MVFTLCNNFIQRWTGELAGIHGIYDQSGNRKRSFSGRSGGCVQGSDTGRETIYHSNRTIYGKFITVKKIVMVRL